jgi:hypothetical protein
VFWIACVPPTRACLTAEGSVVLVDIDSPHPAASPRARSPTAHQRSVTATSVQQPGAKSKSLRRYLEPCTRDVAPYGGIEVVLAVVSVPIMGA